MSVEELSRNKRIFFVLKHTKESRIHLQFCKTKRDMSQENGFHSSRRSNRSAPLRPNNVADSTRTNREIKERGYYSELATMNPESTFEINQQAPLAHDDVLRETFRVSNTARGIQSMILKTREFH